MGVTTNPNINVASALHIIETEKTLKQHNKITLLLLRRSTINRANATSGDDTSERYMDAVPIAQKAKRPKPTVIIAVQNPNKAPTQIQQPFS